MEKKTILTCVMLGVISVLISTEVFAQTAGQATAGFASQDFLDQSSKIQSFLFGPAMRITGVLGGAYGLMQAILSSSLKPLVIYGGIGLAVNLIPKFIDGVFNVSGMLIP